MEPIGAVVSVYGECVFFGFNIGIRHKPAAVAVMASPLLLCDRCCSLGDAGRSGNLVSAERHQDTARYGTRFSSRNQVESSMPLLY